MKKRVMALVLSLAMLASNCTTALAGEDFTDTADAPVSAAENLSAENSFAENGAAENLSEENSAAEKQDSASDIFTDEGQNSESENVAQEETVETEADETVITPDETSEAVTEQNEANIVSESDESDVILATDDNSVSDNAEITPADAEIDVAGDDLVDAAGDTLTSGDYQYTLDNSCNATITKYTGSAASVSVPSSLNGHIVTGIGEAAFRGCKKLQSINLNVNSIGTFAFEGSSIANLTFGSEVETIGPYAFENCEKLENITWGNGIKTIGVGAFQGCVKLYSIDLPDSIKTIGGGAFRNCSNLAALTLPQNVEEIDNMFIAGTSITSIIVPKSVTKAPIASHGGEGALTGADKLTKVVFEDGTEKILSAFCKNNIALVDVIIPESVKQIEEAAFRGCKKLQSINLNVNSIGTFAFEGSSIANLTFGSEVETIGPYAFENCEKLGNITWGNGIKTIGVGAFQGCVNLRSVAYISDNKEVIKKADLTLPRTVTSIGKNAFSGCDNLKSFYYDAYEARWNNICNAKSNTYFANMDKAFNVYACGDKADWKIVDGILEISGTGKMWNFTDVGATKASSDYCQEAPWLSSGRRERTDHIVINGGITSIGDFAFANMDVSEGCTCTIGCGVSEVGSGIIKNSSNIQYMYANGNTCLATNDTASVLYSSDMSTIYACAPAYENAYYVVPSTVTDIKSYAFYGVTNLTQVIFEGNAPASMGNDIFDKCGSDGTFYIHYRDDKSGFGSLKWENCIFIQDYLAIGRDTNTWGNNSSSFFNSLSSENTSGYEIGKDYKKKIKKLGWVKTTDSKNLNAKIKASKNDWTGACKGIYAAMLAKYYGYLNDDIYGQTVSCFSEFNAPYRNTTLRELIHYYHLCQFTQKAYDIRESTRDKAPNHVSYEQIYADILKEAERCSRTKELFWISYDVDTTEGLNGHLIVVCGYRKLDDNNVLLVTYDVNQVDHYEHWIISLNDPVQSFEKLFEKKFEENDTITGLKGVLYTSAAQIKEILKTADPDYDGGKVQDATKNFIELKTNLANVTITDESGHSSVYSNGTLTGNLPVRSTKNYDTDYVGANMDSSGVVKAAGSGSDDASCFTEIELDPGTGYTITGAISGTVSVSLTGTVYECESSGISSISVNKQKGMTIYGSGTYTIRCTDSDRYYNEDEYMYSVTFTSVGDVTAYYDGNRIKLTGTGDISNAVFKSITLDGENTTETSSGDITVPQTSKDLKWNLDADGVLTISGTGKMPDYSKTNPAPWSGQAAKIMEIVITDGITSIDDQAFDGCVNVKAITIPSSVTVISNSLLSNLTSLVKVYAPENSRGAQAAAEISTIQVSVPHTHNWNESITKKALCTTAGEKTSTCTICGLSKNEVIPATGQHTYGAWKTISAATLTAAAKQERTCSVCGAKETRTYGTALKTTIRLNVVCISLKVNQSTTKVKVTSMASGDSISSWKSLNTKVAAVTKAGKITGKKAGTTKIKVTSKSGAMAYVTVIVQKAAVSCTSVKLNSTKVTLNVGKTYQLKTTVNPVTCVQKVTYKSSNTKVASVSSTGKITAKKKGTAVITVKVGTKTAKCKVTVTASKAALKLSKDNVTLRKEDSRTIFATVAGTAAKVTWKSSNTSVAVVESTGTIRAKKKGTAVITATAGGQTAKCKVTVTTTKYLLELSKNSLTLKNGGYYYFSWSITGAPKVTAVWKSSNPSVVSVTTGAVYAHKAGTATITATAGDATDKCVVTVK